MTDQHFTEQHAQQPRSPDPVAGQGTERLMEKTRSLAGDVMGKAREAASDTGSTITRQAKQILNQQLDRGAVLVGDVGNSLEIAANELDKNTPQLGEVAHALADRISEYANSLGNSSVDELVTSANKMTRENPALVFGLAAVAGFLLFRTIKSAPAITPSHSRSTDSSDFNGL